MIQAGCRPSGNLILHIAIRQDNVCGIRAGTTLTFTLADRVSRNIKVEIIGITTAGTGTTCRVMKCQIHPVLRSLPSSSDSGTHLVRRVITIRAKIDGFLRRQLRLPFRLCPDLVVFLFLCPDRMEESKVQAMIPYPKYFFMQRGGLHDARIRQIGWNAPARTISLEIGDLNSSALGLPEYTGAEPGTLVFHDAEDLTFGCDAFVNDVQRVYDVEIEESGDGKYRCTLLISPGGRLTFGFSSVTLVPDPSSAAKAEG